MPTPLLDSTLALAVEGYGWLPNRRRRAGGNAVHTRVLGQRAVGLCGPEAARFFYDEAHIRRSTAIPEPVQGTLFGRGALHTLDGDHHRARKEIFAPLLDAQVVAAVAASAGQEWDAAAASWTGREVVLFDEASRVLTRAICRWAGVPVAPDEVAAVAADLVALVDGFATAGPRHWRARRARGRRERWLADLIERVRADRAPAPPGSALYRVAHHREPDGQPLSPRVAAVELLNVLRPTVAVCWFVAFAGHALRLWPEHRESLREGGLVFAEAFVHELRRFYPFAPFVGGRAVADLSFQGEHIPAGSMVLLDLYGQDHDPALWPDPYTFAPRRFLGRPVGAFDLVPQGAGDPRTGHRCPGERLTVALLETLVLRLARMEYDMPEQDLSISLSRIPARPSSGVVLVPEAVGLVPAGGGTSRSMTDRDTESADASADVATTRTSAEPSTGAAGTASGRAAAAGDAARAAGTDSAADAEATQGQVAGRTVEVDRATAEAGPADPRTGARRDAEGRPIA